MFHVKHRGGVRGIATGIRLITGIQFIYYRHNGNTDASNVYINYHTI